MVRVNIVQKTASKTFMQEFGWFTGVKKEGDLYFLGGIMSIVIGLVGFLVGSLLGLPFLGDYNCLYSGLAMGVMTLSFILFGHRLFSPLHGINLDYAYGMDNRIKWAAKRYAELPKADQALFPKNVLDSLRQGADIGVLDRDEVVYAMEDLLAQITKRNEINKAFEYKPPAIDVSAHIEQMRGNEDELTFVNTEMEKHLP